jgi:uncharacterized protein YndB with AHSA1/START domain
MSAQATDLTVRKTVVVEAPVARAFVVFTEGLATWWPLESHHIGAQPAVAAVMEPRRGGRVYERAADGTECDWGVVRAWEPPGRLVVGWHLQDDWRFDPDPANATEYEVRFIAEGERRTRVELEHRGFERWGERAAEMRAMFLEPNAWALVLDHYAKAASAA